MFHIIMVLILVENIPEKISKKKTAGRLCETSIIFDIIGKPRLVK